MAYAGVLSLLKILKQLEQPHKFPNTRYPKSEIQHLEHRLRSLKEFLKTNSSLENLESEIRDAIYEVEDIIESRISENYSFSFESERHMSILCQDLERLMQELDSIVDRAKNLSDDLGRDTRRPLLPTYRVSSVDGLTRKSIIVGRDDDLNHLKAQLTDESTVLEFVPVVGNPGVGKTVLAQIVYNDPVIASHFKTRAWVKVSLEHSKRDVLLGLLRSLKRLGGGRRQEITEEALAERLAKILRSERYLIVLDDVSNVEAWNDLKDLFRDYNHGSRVMVTTRDAEVALSANSRFHQVNILTDDQSWNLLQMIIFRYKLCPPELEQVAKAVAVSCRGLPLAIVTIGRVLMEASARGDWEIAESSIGDCGNYDQLIQVVISLSYKSLRRHVKGCLLYMAIFPHNYEIPVSKLFNLWIAEGFLQLSEAFGTLEEMAEDCLLKLVNRGIVLVSERSPSGRTRTCRIDGVYHDFLKKEAEEEKFFHVVNEYTDGFPEDSYNQSRFCILKNIRFGTNDVSSNDRSSVSTVRSLLFGGPHEQYPLWVHFDFKLLRVLDAQKIRFYSFPPELFKLVHLRYLALSYNGEIPPLLCKLWNLQFLIVLRYLSSKYSGALPHLPMQIWNMKELRHLQIMGRDLQDPSTDYGTCHLENLLTLLNVTPHSCTAEVLQRIPSLKKLGVRIESPALDADENFNFLSHLDILHRLESFKCVVMHPDFGSQFVPSVVAFPPTLRKLSLSGCGFSWESMKVVASLPNLEVLKLRWYAFRGHEWKTGEGGFLRLKFLLMEDLDIEHWRADCDHFPFLTTLIIRHCYKLQEIPLGIGEIPTLKMIEVGDCSAHAVRSTQQIKEEQLSKGCIQIDFHSSRDD